MCLCVATQREQGRSLGHLNPKMVAQVCVFFRLQKQPLNPMCCSPFSWNATWFHNKSTLVLNWYIMNTSSVLTWFVDVQYGFFTFIHRLQWTARLLAQTGVPHSFHFLLSHLCLWRAPVLWLCDAITQHCQRCSAGWLNGNSGTFLKRPFYLLKLSKSLFCRPNAAVYYDNTCMVQQ